MMRIDRDGWLQAEPGGAPVVHLPTVRTSPLAPVGALGVIWHATGGIGGPRFAEGLARRIQTYRRGIDRPASWHVAISAAKGAIYQSAPFTVATWHVGRPGTIAGVRYANVNAVTIGVELENAGPLVQVRGAFYAWPYWLDRTRRKPDPRFRVAAERSAWLGGRAYDAFTPAQLASARELVGVLARQNGWGAEPFAYCHADFASPMKTDPGELWKAILPGLIEAALDSVERSRLVDDDVAVVTPPPTVDSEHPRSESGTSAGGVEKAS